MSARRHGFRAHATSYVIRSTFGGYNTLGSGVKVFYSAIGRGTYFAASTEVVRARLGGFCSIGQHVLIGGMDKHPTDRLSTHPCFYSSAMQANISLVANQHINEELETNVGSDVWIGAASIVLSGVSIGNGAIVGAGSLVNRDVPPYAIVGGVPAKIIKYRFSPDQIEKLQEMAWWDWSLEKLSSEREIFGLVGEALHSILGG